ncbi:hypothetical protein MTO96_009609 [Rhipicephalus appendiculatus]
MSERPVAGNAAHGGRKPCSRFRFYNLGYFFSLSGLMALCEIILGMAIYALLWDSANELDKFLVTVAFLQWMTGLYIHATIAFCATGARIRGLLLYLLHHGVGAILYLGGAVTTLVSSMYTQTDDIIRTASSLALGASALHLIQATRYLLKHRPGAEGGRRCRRSHLWLRGRDAHRQIQIKASADTARASAHRLIGPADAPGLQRCGFCCRPQGVHRRALAERVQCRLPRIPVTSRAVPWK